MLRFIITVGVFLFFSSCNVSLKYTHEASKWEKNILQFEQLDKSEHYPDNAILFTGSSSIALWETIREDMAPYPVIKRGFGGSKFSDLSIYTERITWPHQFRALVIFEGNDITGSPSDKKPQEVARIFKYIVRKVREKFPEKPIFVIEITPTKARWNVWPQIKEVNHLLAQACQKLHHVYFIPTSSSYLNEKGEPRTEFARTDLLHQNREGYLIWSKLIKERLDEVLGSE